MKLLRIALAWLALCGAAYAQSQVPAGGVMGNSTAATRPPRAETVTAILDRALGSTRGAMIERGSSGWALIPPGTAGLPFVSAGAGADPLYQALGATGGGTGQTVYAIGDLLTANTTTALQRLADVATGNALISGGIGVIPAWGKITSSHLNITTTSCTNQVVTAISAAASGTCSSVAYAMIATADIATTAQYYAGTASKLVQTGIIYPAETTTTFGSTTTFDFSTFINTNVTLTANITTQTLSNVVAGKAGTIRFTQSGAGSFTTVWNSVFKFSGGVTPTLTTGSATAIDVLSYNCITATYCQAALAKDVR